MIRISNAITQNVSRKDKPENEPVLLKVLGYSNNQKYGNTIFKFIIFFAVLLRILNGLGGYSGVNDAP